MSYKILNPTLFEKANFESIRVIMASSKFSRISVTSSYRLSFEDKT